MARLNRRVWLSKGLGFITYRKGTDSAGVAYEDLVRMTDPEYWDAPLPPMTEIPPTEKPAVKRWYGSGPPTTIVGSSPGDEYMNTDNGDLYILG